MSDFKKQADEEKNKKERLKGKFQAACAMNVGGGWMRVIREYEAGWERRLHCSCHVCDYLRKDNGEKMCIDQSCEGCKNMKAGKKIRSWEDIWSHEAQKKADDAY